MGTIPPSQTGPDDDPIQWFELDEFDQGRCTEDYLRFLELLREHAVNDGWRCDPEYTEAFVAGGLDYRGLRVVLSISDRVGPEPTHLLDYGVVFDGERILGDRVGSQSHDFEGKTPERFEDAGSVPYLADVTARWFKSLLDRPIEYRRWFDTGIVRYREWVIPETGQVILKTHGRYSPMEPPDEVIVVSGVT